MEDAPRDEVARYHSLQGRWRIVYSEIAGKPNELRGQAIEVYEGTTYHWEHGDLQSYPFEFRVETGKTPHEIDIISDEGTLHGIYAVIDDTLLTCFCEEDGDARPERFGPQQFDDSSAIKSVNGCSLHDCLQLATL